MAKIKKGVITVILFLLTIVQCISFVACGRETSSEEHNEKSAVGNEEVAPLGLYTDLQFSLNGENGQVRASVKNKFTLFSSTVTVNVELYRSDSFQDNVANMTLAASNYIYDLDQGETVTATASTEGKQSYWKAKASYRVDNADWQTNFSDTVFLDKNGLKTTEPVPAPDDREYFIYDFLQDDAEIVQITMYYKHKLSYYPQQGEVSYSTSEAFVGIDNEDERNAIKGLFGKIKLDEFDIEDKSFEQQQQFGFLLLTSPYYINIRLGDGSKALIYIDDGYSDSWNANLFVHYYGENVSSKYFTATISDEAKQALIDFTKNMYETRHNINSSVTDWRKLEDLMQEEVLSAHIDMRLSLPRYDSEQNLIPEKRIEFKFDKEDLSSVKKILNEVVIAPFDMDKDLYGAKASGWFNTSCKYAWYSLFVKFDNDISINIYVSDGYKNTFGINVYVVYNDGETTQTFTGLISNETQKDLDELTVQIYKNKGE